MISAKQFRQTIMFSGYMNPDINGLFHNSEYCDNIRGKVKVRNFYKGITSLIQKPVPQVILYKNGNLLFF